MMAVLSSNQGDVIALQTGEIHATAEDGPVLVLVTLLFLL
jgi:hypothetical protein